MSLSHEGSFTTRDGTNLFTKTWQPKTPSARHLVFIHGFSDHISAYYDLFPTLSSPPFNITVHGFDQRGWGRSVKSKSDQGLTGDTHQVLCDMYDFISHVSNSINTGIEQPKLFLMGHSMGGAQSIMYVLSDLKSLAASASTSALPISGLLLEAPFIALPSESAPSRFTVLAGRLTAKIMPNMQMVSKLDPSFMCRDPKVCKDWDSDTLCHDTGTLRGLAGMLDRASILDSFDATTSDRQPGMRNTLPCPVWWAHGTADKVCDFAASKKLYAKLAATDPANEHIIGSRFVELSGGFHKLHGEPNGMKEELAKGAGDWMMQIADGNTEGNSNHMSAPEDAALGATAGTNPEGPGSVKSRL